MSTPGTHWSAQQQDDVPEDMFEAIATQRGLAGQTRDHTRFARYLLTALSNRRDGTPRRLVRNGRHKDGVTLGDDSRRSSRQ